MFFTRSPQGKERQAIMDELVDLDPGERRVRLDAAVAERRLSNEDREQVVRILDRLENLRIMLVPSVRRWPEEELIGVPPSWALNDTLVPLPQDYDRSELIGISIDDTGVAEFEASPAPAGDGPSMEWLRPEGPARGQPVARPESRRTLRRKARRRDRRQALLRLSGQPAASRPPARSH